MLVDDNEDFCKLFGNFIKFYPEFELIASAGDGLTAYDIITRQKPDILILDNIMPHLDGMGLLEKLCEEGLINRIKVIMFTAFGQEEITKRALELGADYYILKPFSLNVLMNRVIQLAKTEKNNKKSSFVNYNRAEELLQKMLSALSISPGIKGYSYVVDSVLALALSKDEDGLANTKNVYPLLAKRNNTTVSSVERAIRHALSTAWEGHPIKEKDFLVQNGLPESWVVTRPQNLNFIAALAVSVRNQIMNKIPEV